MNLENYRSDRFGQALFNALLDGFERAQVVARRETEPSKNDLAQSTQPHAIAHRYSEPRQ